MSLIYVCFTFNHYFRLHYFFFKFAGKKHSSVEEYILSIHEALGSTSGTKQIKF
jgi:hypothetical protein